MVSSAKRFLRELFFRNESRNMEVILSSQAYLSMVGEAYSFVEVETGGIFLGHCQGDKWYVLEVIDPGYSQIVRQHSYFEYDVDYVNHLANVRSRIYETPLVLLGLWHRHPGSFDTFSSVDDRTNKDFAQILPQGAISAIVNIDPTMRITMYHVGLPLRYTKIKKITIGDSHIPEELARIRSTRHVVNEYKKKQHNDNSNVQHATAPSPEQEALIDMLDIELTRVLDLQDEYTYTVEMSESSIEIRIEQVDILCTLQIIKGQRLANIDGHSFSYKPGIIGEYLREIFSSHQSYELNDVDEEAYYASVLDVEIGSSSEDLHRAFHTKVKDFHPDRWQQEENDQIKANAAERYRECIKARDFFRDRHNNHNNNDN